MQFTSPCPIQPEVSLPEWIIEALKLDSFSPRFTAVGELIQLLNSEDQILNNLAYEELLRLSHEDPAEAIRGAATAALDSERKTSAIKAESIPADASGS